MWGQSRWRGPFTQPRALPQSPQDRRPAAGRAQLCAGTRDYYSHPERPSPEARCQLHRGTCRAEPWQRQLQALSCMASAGLGGDPRTQPPLLWHALLLPQLVEGSVTSMGRGCVQTVD